MKKALDIFNNNSGNLNWLMTKARDVGRPPLYVIFHNSVNYPKNKLCANFINYLPNYCKTYNMFRFININMKKYPQIKIGRISSA